MLDPARDPNSPIARFWGLMSQEMFASVMSLQELISAYLLHRSISEGFPTILVRPCCIELERHN